MACNNPNCKCRTKNLHWIYHLPDDTLIPLRDIRHKACFVIKGPEDSEFWGKIYWKIQWLSERDTVPSVEMLQITLHQFDPNELVYPVPDKIGFKMMG